MRIAFVLAMGLALWGCTPRTAELRKSAVVPHVTPPSWGGQPLPARVGIGVRASNLLLAADPAARPGRPSGLYLSQSQGSFDVRIGLERGLELAGLFDLALDETAAATTDEVVARPTIGPAWGLGSGAHYTIVFRRFQLGIGLDLFLYSLPVRIQEGHASQQGRSFIGVYSFSLLPSYRHSERLAIFGGGTARNHPDIDKRTVENLGATDEPAGAWEGPTNVVLAAGAVYRLSGFLLVHGQVYVNVVDHPVAYPSPGVDLGLTVLLGDPPGTKPSPPPEIAPSAGPAPPPAFEPEPAPAQL